MQTLNGYQFDVIREQVFDQLRLFTAKPIRKRIADMQQRVMEMSGPIYLSFGENCGPSVKIKQANLPTVGSGYFDNIVTPLPSIVSLLDNDFVGILSLSNLIIGQWEHSDSVFNVVYRTFFHHYFHPRCFDFEKSVISGGNRRRVIDDADIPLFLPEVMATFEYLHEKLKFVLRSDIQKYIVLRQVDGQPIEVNMSDALHKALERYGAKAFAIRVVHSTPLLDKFVHRDIHRFIPELDERWGNAERWRSIA